MADVDWVDWCTRDRIRISGSLAASGPLSEPQNIPNIFQYAYMYCKIPVTTKSTSDKAYM
jgi:hypothetical protein